MVLVAVLSALGFFGYVGVTGNLIILNVVPFLILAVGIDNLFTIVDSYEVSDAMSIVAPIIVCLSVHPSVCPLKLKWTPMSSVMWYLY